MFDTYGGFDMFSLFDIIFPLFFIAFIGMFIFVIVRAIKEWSYNNSQPQIPSDAIVVSKRQNTSHHHNAGNNMHSHTRTSYYITFEFSNGERLELSVPSKEYGMIAEGDIGILISQGRRYISFDRKI